MRTVAERSTNDRPRRFPLGAGKEAAPRIGIPQARSHKDIPPAQRLAQLVEYTKGVRPVIDSIVHGVHVSLPGFRHDSRRSHALGCSGRFTTPEVIERRYDGRAGRGRFELHMAQQCWHEQTNASVPRLQLS